MADFSALNIMAGTAKSFDRRDLSSDDLAIWNRDFDLLVTELSGLVDPGLGMDLLKEKTFYQAGAEVAKGYFNGIPFGGLKVSTGQFGFRLIGPQDLCTSATSDTPAMYSWRQTVATGASTTAKTYVIGNSGADAYIQNVAMSSAVMAFHRLISWIPAPRITALAFTINEYPYAPYNTDLFSKVGKEGKLFKVIPMPGRVLLHPGGRFHIDAYFDLQGGASAPSGASNIDVELAPFGLVFGHYNYLAASNMT